MKSDTTSAVMTFVLGVMVVAGVILVFRNVVQTRELQTINVQASLLNQSQLLVNEVAAYNQKNPSPELTKMLQPFVTKPAAAK